MSNYNTYRRTYAKVLREIAALIEAEAGGKPTDRRSLAFKVHALVMPMITRKIPDTAKDMTGKRVGRLVVLRRDWGPRRDANRAQWIALCDCGKETSVEGAALRRKSRSRGKTRSCGCLRGENLRNGDRYKPPRPRVYLGGYHTPPLTEARVAEAGWSLQRERKAA